MIKDNNKSLSQSQIADEESQNNKLELRVSTPDLSFCHPSKPDIIKINDESELQKNELESQIEDLKNALKRAETATALYDFSPVGFFTLTHDGTIEHLNTSAANMLDEHPSFKSPSNIREYLSADSLVAFDDFLQKAFHTKAKQTCELILISKGNPAGSAYIYVEGIVSDKEKCLLTAINIDKQKEAEGEIKKQRQFFEQVFSQSSVSTQILDKEGWCVKINPKLSELFGVSAEDIQGHNYNIFKDASVIKENLIPHLDKVFKEGKTAEWDVHFDIGLAAESQNIEVTDKGKRWFHNWAYPIFDEEGNLSHAIIQHTDISKRKNDEERLSDSEARYRRLFESAKDGIVILDAGNGNILDVNPYFSYLLGYTHEEIVNKPLWDIGIFKYSSDAEEMVKELQDNGYIRYDNILLSTKNCKTVHVEFTCNTYLVDQKKVVQCNIRNITERIKAEKEIHTLRKAIEQGPSAITITNAEGNIEFVNNKFIELTQYLPTDVMGKQPRIFNEGHLPPEQYAELWETLKSGRIWEGKVMNRRKDHSYFWEETTISAVKNLDGSISNYILIQNDISEKQQIIHDLILAKERAIEGDLLKTAFLANMSHEIRTPLNSIIGFSELMTDEDFDHNQLLHFAKIINSSGNKLLSIISDIMDLSRIEAGEIKVEKRKLSVNQLIANIQKEYLFKAVEKDIELRIDPSTPTDEIFIESDENKLRQILINFVGNAIKFTEKGTIDIGMKKTGKFVHVQVKDTGIGIPAQYQDRIFERFRQVENAYTKKYGGNGLGLAISKALVELLGGQIGMETEQGKGSTFYFTVPLA